MGYDAEGVYYLPNLRMRFVESTLYPFIGGDTVEHPDMERSGLQPSVNLILPYVYPEHLRQCGADAAYTFSRTCIENTLYIIEALETAYRRVYARSLTLRRFTQSDVVLTCRLRAIVSQSAFSSSTTKICIPFSSCVFTNVRLCYMITQRHKISVKFPFLTKILPAPWYHGANRRE